MTVEASAVALQTDKADTHSEITTAAITNMPIGGYRNYQMLINLVPGAMPAALQNSITDTPGRALSTHINGGNAKTNITRIDGAASVNVWLPHHVGYVTPEENVEVVNVTTGSADAEQGMAGSSAVTLVTKSGTNQLHGSAFEFNNNQHLNSRAFFQAAGTDKPLAIYNDFGGTVGGAIKKNKLFYFLSLRRHAAAPGFARILHGSHQRLQDRRFQRGSHRDLRPQHGQCQRHRPHPVCRQYHSVEPHRFDRTEDPELLPVAQLRRPERVRQQLFCFRRPHPQPQLPGCQGELHGQRQGTGLGQIRAYVGEIGRHRRIRHREAGPASAAPIPASATRSSRWPPSATREPSPPISCSTA